jgi:hypothetical protein
MKGCKMHKMTGKYGCACGWEGDSPAEFKMHVEIETLRGALTKAKYFDWALVFYMDNPFMYRGLKLAAEQESSAMERLAFEKYNGLEWYRDEMSMAIEEYQIEFGYLTNSPKEMPSPPDGYKNNDYDGTPERIPE